MSPRGLTFPLIQRRRMLGMAFGAIHGARRGTGSDVAGSRPYVPGDDRDAIDWAASARLSSARSSDEFIVREHFADEAPRAVIVVDRRPEMALCPADLPWLRKYEAVRVAADLIAESVAEARGLVGYLDFAEGVEQPFWRPPRDASERWAITERHLAHTTFGAPPDAIERAFDFLGAHRRALPSGSFVFVLSDFLVSPDRETWERALDRHWDVVPVIIQDPVWEQSFPSLDGVVVPLREPGGRLRLVRLRRGESDQRRQAHAARCERLLADFRSLGMPPIVLSAADRDHVLDAFLDWTAERQFRRGHW